MGVKEYFGMEIMDVTLSQDHIFNNNNVMLRQEQQQHNGAPNGLVEPFALAVPIRVAGGGRAERNAARGEV